MKNIEFHCEPIVMLYHDLNEVNKTLKDLDALQQEPTLVVKAVCGNLSVTCNNTATKDIILNALREDALSRRTRYIADIKYYIRNFYKHLENDETI